MVTAEFVESRGSIGKLLFALYKSSRQIQNFGVRRHVAAFKAQTCPRTPNTHKDRQARFKFSIVTPQMKIETLAVHAGHDVDPSTGAVATPIYLSTTFERDAEGTYS